MSDSVNIVLIIIYIFLVTTGLVFFFNITLRYIGKLSRTDIILVILVVLVSIVFGINLYNYSKNYSSTRNVQRLQDVQQIADAVYNFTVDYRYRIKELGDIPACPQVAVIGTAENNLNLAEKFSEYGLGYMPYDPSVGTDLNTGYTICLTETGRIVVSAPNAENGEIITVKR